MERSGIESPHGDLGPMADVNRTLTGCLLDHSEAGPGH
jgi:hypothetical protein